MSDLKKRVAKLEVIALPTMERFIKVIGMETFKTMLDYLQAFVDAGKAAPKINGMIDIDFNSPKELREYFIRWSNIPGSEVFKKALDSKVK